jgi:hypothetical protein
VTDYIFRDIAMNYMSRETYRRKIVEAIEDRIKLTQLHDVILEKVSKYDLQIDKFDDYGHCCHIVSNLSGQSSRKI